MADNLLDIQNLSVSIGDKSILHGINLNIMKTKESKLEKN